MARQRGEHEESDRWGENRRLAGLGGIIDQKRRWPSGTARGSQGRGGSVES